MESIKQILGYSSSNDSLSNLDIKSITKKIILFLQQRSLQSEMEIIPILEFLDRHSDPENFLLETLEKVDIQFFRMSKDYLLKNCWNSKHIFSDAVRFLQLWLKSDPSELLKKLKDVELRPYLVNVEYDKDGDQWHFSRLLSILENGFKSFIKTGEVTHSQIIDVIFDNFGFLEDDIAQQFIREVIGYGKLKVCIENLSIEFREPLIKKMHVMQRQGNDIGPSLLFLERSNRSSESSNEANLIACQRKFRAT